MADRYTLEKAEKNRSIIYDNEELDDYWFTDDDEEVRNFLYYINKLDEKHKHNLQVITEAYKSERTAMGKSAIRQIINNMRH